MQTVSKYADLYQKKHQHNLDLRDLKNETYVQYLETQLDKVTASINVAQSFDERILNLEKNHSSLKEKLTDQTKYIKLFQNFAEIQEEENANTQDMLSDLSSKVNSQTFDQQFELMKSTMNQSLKIMDQEICDKLSKYTKNTDQRFFAFQERLQNQVLNKFQNFGGLQDLIDSRLGEIRSEINTKIQCLFQEIQESVTQMDLQQLQEKFQNEQHQYINKLEIMEERVTHKQQYLHDLAEELISKVEKQNTQRVEQYQYNEQTRERIDLFLQEQKQAQNHYEHLLQDYQQDIQHRIDLSFNQLTQIFRQNLPQTQSLITQSQQNSHKSSDSQSINKDTYQSNFSNSEFNIQKIEDLDLDISDSSLESEDLKNIDLEDISSKSRTSSSKQEKVQLEKQFVQELKKLKAQKTDSTKEKKVKKTMKPEKLTKKPK